MSMKNKIGIDICAISRMKMDDDQFLARFLHPKELQYLKSLDNKKVQADFAAGRWAAKEAMFKAYNFKDNFNTILITTNNQQPQIQEPLSLVDFEISISHDDNFAIAVAIFNVEPLVK